MMFEMCLQIYICSQYIQLQVQLETSKQILKSFYISVFHYCQCKDFSLHIS